MSGDTVAGNKQALRERVLRCRDGLSAKARTANSRICADRLYTLVEAVCDPPAVVAGFIPIRSEIDIVPTLQRLAARGYTIALPVVEASGQPLSFRCWDGTAALQDAGFGTRGPGVKAAVVDPDILIVPLSAFDRHGGRMGYGKGHYDTSIMALKAHKRVMTIGAAYAMQQVDSVPQEPHDQRLQWIVTDEGVLDCRPGDHDRSLANDEAL